MDPITLFERAATRAAALARTVEPAQHTLPTPCSEWNVAALLEHMGGGAAYLLGSMGADPAPAAGWPAATAVRACLDALRGPGALERRCPSPAGFEWSVGEAAAGTAMDQLIHTWDLATTLGVDADLDPETTEAIAAMFLPAMPEVGRQAGFVGPEVPVPADAPAEARLLGAMGRRPGS